MQNNYAWSMAELDGYMYIGTGRNIPYSAMAGLGVEIPPELTPKNPSNDAEIWRYPLSGIHKKWEQVYKAPGIMGFRDVISYTSDHGVTALYFAAFGVNKTNPILMTVNGRDFTEISGGIPAGYSTRAMAIHGGKLYTGATNAIDFSPDSYLFVTENPEKGWRKVDFEAGQFPTGEVVSMISFNGYLYIGTSPAGGFEVWKSADPEKGEWQLVVDRGAGDALNEVPMSMEVYKGHLYVGSGIWIGLQSVDPDKTIVPPKGYDVIRINKCDHWEVVVGSKPIAPTKPTTGKRNRTYTPSGFGSIFNSYCWQICSYKGRLFIGSWDSAVLWNSILKGLLSSLGEDSEEDDFSAERFSLGDIMSTLSKLHFEVKPEYNIIEWIKALRTSLPKYPKEFGFDFWETDDGECFRMISRDGLENRHNYGLRTLVVTDDGEELFIGTANPYQGCEVWRLKE